MSDSRPCLTVALVCAISVCCHIVTPSIAQEGAPTDVQRQTKLVLPTVQPEATPELIALPTSTHSKPIQSVKFSRDGRTLVTRAGGELFVWDLAGRFVRWRFPAGLSDLASEGMGVSPDGTLVAVNDGNWLGVWDTRASRRVSELNTAQGGSSSSEPVFSADGTQIAVYDRIRMGDPDEPVDHLSLLGGADGYRGSVTVFEAMSGRCVDEYTTDQGSPLDLQVAFRPDGTLRAAYDVSLGDTSAQPSRIAEPSGRRTVELQEGHRAILSADGQWLVDCPMPGGRFHVRLRSTADWSVRYDVDTEVSIPVACNATHVLTMDYTGEHSARLSLLDLEKRAVRALPGEYGSSGAGDLSVDGAYLATEKGVFDVGTGRLLLATPTLSGRQSCRFGPGERSLLSLCEDRVSTIRRTGSDPPDGDAADLMQRRLVYVDSFVCAWAGPDGLHVLPRGPADTRKPGFWPRAAGLLESVPPSTAPWWDLTKDLVTPLSITPWWDLPGNTGVRQVAIGLEDDGTIVAVVFSQVVFCTPDGRAGGATSGDLVLRSGLQMADRDVWRQPAFDLGARKLIFFLDSGLYAMDVGSGTITSILSDTDPARAWFLADGKTIAMHSCTDWGSTARHGRLQLLGMESRERTAQWDLGKDDRVLATASGGSRVIVSNGTEALVYALPAGTPTGSIPARPGQTISCADISFTGDRLILTYGDGESTFWDLSPLDAGGEPKLLGTIYDWADGEWATVTPSGFVDCSPGAGRYLAWQQGDKVYPFEQFATKCRRPILVRQALAGEDISAAGKLTGADVPPTAAFLAPEYDAAIDTASAMVKLEVAAVRAIERVDLLIDGRPVPEDIAAAAKWEPMGESHGTYTFDLPLSQYQHRTRLQAIVHDAEGLQSMPAEVTFTRAGAPAPTSVLHALSVGVSRYRNEEWNTLKFADKDAESFAQVAGGTSRQLLTNEDATTTNVRFALETMKAAVTEDDVAVVFLAGHGAVDGDGNYYFLLHDTDKADLENTALPWDDFVTALKGIRARLVMVFADTCHSGSLTGSESVNTLIDRLNRKAGVVVFTASRGDEASIEREDWGHGAFTKALLEGFAGQADTYPVDKQVSLAELRDYVLPRVDELTSGRQHPYIPRLQDFDPARPICSVVPGAA